MVRQKPIMIVMTPVRNEAWVLRAFLETTTHWADYIIIADQMSTDGSRDLYKEYQERLVSLSINGHHCELIVIDNTNPDFNEAERQSMLIAKAREVAAGRDTLLWGLDADEILAADAFETDDWKRILTSQPGDVFWFKWAEICPNQKEYWESIAYPWLFHDDGNEPHGNYVRNMHSMRIPYPIEEKQMYHVDDFRVLHLAYLNTYRVNSKRRFYKFVDWEMNRRNPITLSRNYAQAREYRARYALQMAMLSSVNSLYLDIDILSLVDTTCTHCYMDEYIVKRLPRHKIAQLRKLDIWEDVFCGEYHLRDPRRVLDKCVHRYLQVTRNLYSNTLIRGIDKVLKWLYK